MKNFIAIDFETGNPKRVSACALGYAKVLNGEIVETNGYLIKPVGGHASFQTKIHGIKEEDTEGKPDFCELFEDIRDVFSLPLIGHSLFDKQVLNALSNHFNLDLKFDYTDSCSVAKICLPELKNHKLKTLAKHFELTPFKHHDAAEDSRVCADIFLKLQENMTEDIEEAPHDEIIEFKGLAKGILADDEVNYKEAYELLYWLEDHTGVLKICDDLYIKTKQVLEDDKLDDEEALELRNVLRKTLEFV
jgi:DNA polymerase III subunit epsilon